MNVLWNALDKQQQDKLVDHLDIPLLLLGWFTGIAIVMIGIGVAASIVMATLAAIGVPIS